MKKTKDKLISMGGAELEKRLASLQESARVIKFKSEGSKSKNVKESVAIRKDIARILTQMNKN